MSGQKKTTRTGQNGFSAVFLTLILGSMMVMTLTFVQAAAQKAAESTADSVFRLAALSVLGEYDLDLYRRYGIIAHGRSEEEIEALIRMYGNTTFRNKRPMDLLRNDLQSIEVSLAPYSLLDCQRFEDELAEIMVLRLAGNALRSMPEAAKGSDQRPQRKLKNKNVLKTLPSGGKGNLSLVTQAILEFSPEQLGNMVTKAHRYYLANEYAKHYFSHDKESKLPEAPAFFRNEMEYLLYGADSDWENKNRFLNDFTALRTALNLAHILSDAAKMKELTALANTVAPGPGAPAALATLTAAWALSEAINDRKILNEGGTVPLLKQSVHWALSIENLHRQEGGAIYPSVRAGKNYAEHLELFLYLANHEKKLLRMMDLIQINMKLECDRNFTMSSRCKGFAFVATVSGKAYSYEKEY